jgi:hypothetical protein
MALVTINPHQTAGWYYRQHLICDVILTAHAPTTSAAGVVRCRLCLDGRFPITLQTAEQVKQILRFCDPRQDIATRYAQYM